MSGLVPILGTALLILKDRYVVFLSQRDQVIDDPGKVSEQPQSSLSVPIRAFICRKIIPQERLASM
jgi:hypothetical protein